MIDAEECIVKGCKNHPWEGAFRGTLCSPCHDMLSRGITAPSEAWFVGRIRELEEEIEGLREDAVWASI